MQIPEPAHNPILIGHGPSLSQITEAFAGGRLYHAWMISGIEGIGKATLAYHIANYVLSGGRNQLGNLDLNQPAAKLIKAEAHPDMIVVRRMADEKSGELRNVIVVDDVLKLAPFMHKTATHGGWRVAIIDEAQTLNRFGQNALLKILEEPPSRCLILMTTTIPGALLPTIRSRCRPLNLEPLSQNHMKTILARLQVELPPNELAHLVQLSAGSIGFALKIIRTETLPLYDALLELLKNMPVLDIAKLHKLADQIARKADAESFTVISTLLIDVLRRSVRAQAMGESSIGSDQISFPQGKLDRSLRLWEKVHTTFTTADSANLDRKLAFINVMTDIRQSVA